MKTRLFEWAKEQGLSPQQLSTMTGYSERHLYRIKTGEWPITEDFMARVVFKLGDWARDLFYDER